jgi:hypothetical protein
MYKLLSSPDSVSGYAEQRIIDHLKKNGTATSTELYNLSSKRSEPLKWLLEQNYIGELLPIKVEMQYEPDPQAFMEYCENREKTEFKIKMEWKKKSMEEAIQLGSMTKKEMDQDFINLYKVMNPEYKKILYSIVPDCLTASLPLLP